MVDSKKQDKKMIKGIILDFDQTIADTSMLKKFRDLRQWDAVHKNIDCIVLVEGFDSFYQYITQRKLKTCIVSRAPYHKYIKHALKKFNLNFDHVIGYEEGGYKKPSPIPMIKALELMGLKSNEVMAIGDEIRDSQAARTAGIQNIVLYEMNQFANYCVENFNECIEILNKMEGK